MGLVSFILKVTKNLIVSKGPPNDVSMPERVWTKFDYWFKRKSADRAFSSLYEPGDLGNQVKVTKT